MIITVSPFLPFTDHSALRLRRIALRTSRRTPTRPYAGTFCPPERPTPNAEIFSKLLLFLRVSLSEHDSANLEAISWFSGSSCGSSQQIDAITLVRKFGLLGHKKPKK